MAKTIDQLIDDVLAREGGYVDHPNDRGGPTKFGITMTTLAKWVGRPVSRAEVEQITELDARQIYRERYFLDPKIHLLPEPWQPLVFDWGVNSGPITAVRELQKLCRAHGCDPGRLDGLVGPKTIAAATKLLTLPLHWYLVHRKDFYQRIVDRDPTQDVFVKGWTARVDGLEKGLM